VTNTGKRGQAR